MKKKIIHLVCTFPPYRGGMGNSVARITEYLKKEGQDVEVVTPTYRNDSTDLYNEVKITRLKPVLSIGNAGILPAVFWKIKNYDIIHLHYPFYGIHLLVYLGVLLWKKTLILHYHMDTEAKGLKGLIFKLNSIFIEPLLLNKAKVIIGSSLDYLNSSRIGSFISRKNKLIKAVPFGVKEEYFERKNIIKKTNKFVFVGALDRAHYFKGIPILINALSILVASNEAEDWMLEIIGEGDMRSEYEELTHSLNLQGRIKFLPKVDDQELMERLQVAGCLVLPSINKGEAFGIVLTEAMASGIPVIASNLPGVRSVFKCPEHGLLVEPGDILSLANAMKKMIIDADYRLKAGENAFEFARKTYNPKSTATMLCEIYNEISNENSVNQ